MNWGDLFSFQKPAPLPANISGKTKDEELTQWCAKAARDLGFVLLSKKIIVLWNSKMRTTAGRALWPDTLVELNPKLKECGEGEVMRTLKHELAHLLVFEKCGRRKVAPHGAEWQQACALLGIPEEKATHSLPFARRQMKQKYVYICNHCKGSFKRVRPLRRTAGCYDCCRKHNGGVYDSKFRLVKYLL